MVNYSNSKIYKIIDNTNGNIYIGSTCQPLSKRLAAHRSAYNQYMKGKKYVKSCDILKNNDYNIILIENYSCTDKEELLARERYFIENTKCINTNIPGRKSNEWQKENQERRNELQRKRRAIKGCEKQCKIYAKKRWDWIYSWGGTPRSTNNLLSISLDVFN